ncbi:MAG TPA: response regulator transcription factor [Candidatus Binatia bacterium]|jgi:DNA-binding NarL/FixJ family response regulator
MPIRLILADDHALFREGLKSLLKHEPDVTVVAEAETMDRLLALLPETVADVLLLDVQMDRSSLGDIPAIAARIPVIVVTASELIGDALAAVRLGVRAVVLKRFAVETLMDAIRSVATGQVWLPPHVQGELAARLREPHAIPLSTREEEVVRHVALGLRNAEVARKLFISEQTVKTHLNNIFQRLGLRDRTELTVYAIRTGIIGVHERP